MADIEPIPRYDLYERPWKRMTSPGASSVPGKSDQIITVCAPAASAFTMSQEYLIPPSEMQGTPCRVTARTQLSMALICGTPTPATTRVRSEEHTSELQSQSNLVCRLLLEK